MAFQAFMDESGKHEGGAFIIGGCIATAESWAAFAVEWEQMLRRFGRVDASGRYFHMTEMRNMEEVMFFYRVIERHVPVYLSCRINLAELERARARIYVPGAILLWEAYADAYYVAYRCLMDKFHLERRLMTQVLPADEPVDFYFDNHGSKVHVRKAWDDYLATRPDDIRPLYGIEPHFENDREFLPLQAADLWAWWVRKWCDDNEPERIGAHDFGPFQRTPENPRLTIDIVFAEDQLLVTFERMARENAKPGAEVIVLPVPPPKID